MVQIMMPQFCEFLSVNCSTFGPELSDTVNTKRPCSLFTFESLKEIFRPASRRLYSRCRKGGQRKDKSQAGTDELFT